MALGLVGGLITAAAATGSKVLYGFSRRDLELYCRRRNHRELFDEILDRHEQAAVAAESLQIVGTVLLVLSTGFWFFPEGAGVIDNVRHLITVILASAVLLLALTTWLPWAVVRVWSAPFLYRTWAFWKIVTWMLWPLTLGVQLVNVVAHRLAGQQETEEDEEEAFEDEIRTIVTAGLRDGLLEADAREMIEGVIELGDVDVAEIMTPRSDVEAVDVELGWPEVLEFLVRVGRTRIPVYEKTLDNIVGILYVKDLLAEMSKGVGQPLTPLRQLLRKPWFVPQTKRVDDVLKEFRRTRSHMAIVVDEYGATTGVVTIEDALEEIVGEIADESDTEQEVDLVRVDANTLEADGRVHVDELNEQFGLQLPESEDYATIAGFVETRLKRIPEAGEIVHHDGVQITILKASHRRIERVQLKLMEQPQAESSEAGP